MLGILGLRRAISALLGDLFHINDSFQDQEFVMQAGPTLAGDVVQQQEEEEEESLHLHLSASHPNESSCLQQVATFP